MQRIKTFKTLTRAASAGLFLSVQVIICIGTVYWAIAETLGMARTAAMVLGTVPSVYAVFLVVRMAFEAETDPANQ